MNELRDLRVTNDRMVAKRRRMADYRKRTKPILLLRLGIRNGWIR
jgi:hypothetical protein